jgi:magnesium-transporting ATPase (P-type)
VLCGRLGFAVMPALLASMMDKANTRIRASLHLYKQQPLSTRLLILLFFAIHTCVFFFLVFYLGPEKVFNYTAQLAIYIRTFSFPRTTLIFLVCIVSFPPLIGYGTLITLCGMAYGGTQKVQGQDGIMVVSGSLVEAWCLAAGACMMGSLVSFLVLRSFLLTSSIGRKLTRIDSLRASRQWRAMEQAIGQRGLSMVILVR